MEAAQMVARVVRVVPAADEDMIMVAALAGPWAVPSA
jgi:hypothetical protein